MTGIVGGFCVGIRTDIILNRMGIALKISEKCVSGGHWLILRTSACYLGLSIWFDWVESSRLSNVN
jgi:hypothetical protein